ncbi:MAG: leucine-rich repeat protein [Candidatus Methanomethylophilaceae archaeon]|nr:leucine-rich repeat protein [Candidatus Methanomethylophilaceae archaeon]
MSKNAFRSIPLQCLRIIIASSKATSGVGSVGKHAFYGCALTKANLSSATKIGYGAFTGNDLREVTFGGGLESVDPKAFFRYSFWDAGENRIPVSAQDLAGKTFEGSGKILSELPEN